MSNSRETFSASQERTLASPTSGAAAVGQNLWGLLRTMRPKQWTKNSFVLAPLIFDAKLFVLPALGNALVAVVCFCLASSSVYILNDLVDIEKDRQHPRKRLRALPSGQLNPIFAAIMGLALALVSVVGMAWIEPWAGAIVGVYLVQNIAYSFWLKNLVIIDVMMIALGFLLRVEAGVLAVDVQNFSPWLYVCASLLALFLGFGKRRHEVFLLEEAAGSHRASLDHYTLPFLDQIIAIITTSTLVGYTLYSFEAETALAGGGKMMLTVPFVFYGILRYLYLIHVKEVGGAPDELLLQDKPLLFSVALWAASVVAVIYVW